MRGEKQLVLPVHTAGNISHLITNCKSVQVPTTPLFCLCSSEGMKGCLTQQSPAMCTQNSKGTHVTYVQTQVGGKQLNIRRVSRQEKNHWFPWRANQCTLIREILFSSVPHSSSLVSVFNPWPFKRTQQCPSRASSSFVRYFGNYRDAKTTSGVAH